MIAEDLYFDNQGFISFVDYDDDEKLTIVFHIERKTAESVSSV